ncbi:MAG: transcriptional regulator, partial [Verrucomicrobia bacterium]|nr:transcriptional regulator [Verrucomicrobiota bacterium]
RRAIVGILKLEGPADSVALASRLGVSSMAVRQHLYALRDDRIVTYEEQPRPMGRPAKMWRLTRAAAGLFPDTHAALACALLQATGKIFGPKGLAQVVRQCAHNQIESYRQRIPQNGSPQKRLKALASILSEEGYMAEVETRKDGSFLLIQNHCPISTAANVCAKLCDAELELFQGVLGEGLVVQRLEHMVAGTRRCAYRIQAKAPAPNRK